MSGLGCSGSITAPTAHNIKDDDMVTEKQSVSTDSASQASTADCAFKLPDSPVVMLPPVKLEKSSKNDSVPPTSVADEGDSGSRPQTATAAGTKPADSPVLSSPAELVKAKSIPLPYKEPSWGGVAKNQYYLEILKNGVIVDTIQLRDKSFFVIGRLANCDILLEHPSLSRYHAVLQFKSLGSPEKPSGFYLFDLDSTHGSFHNKNKCFPKTYYRLRVGHMLKFGLSTRNIILQGPEEDSEEESELSITELKSLSAEKLRKREEIKEAQKENNKEISMDQDESYGVSWGMADDADEHPDMDQNPYAETAENENLYINDPKKELTKWFDREGYDLEYDIEEKGPAQFLCKISLPVDSVNGGPTVAEALVKGKKKEATLQAALEACRMLDRMGMLRPTQQTSAEKKVRKWEEDDFYASDEDEFLDRTGSIEKKRKNRMRLAGKSEESVDTYDTLINKHTIAQRHLVEAEAELKQALSRKAAAENRSRSNDLDSYLIELSKGAQIDKETIQKLKMKISTLTQELEKLTTLINIAKPATLPELKTTNSSKLDKSKYSGIIVGKRGSKGLLGRTKTVNKDMKTAVAVNTRDTKVLEAFLNESNDNHKQNRYNDEADVIDKDEIQPIGYEPRAEPKPKDRIGDTTNNYQALSSSGTPEESFEVSSVEQGQEDQSRTDGFFGNDCTETDTQPEKRSRGDRGTKRRKKLEDEEKEENFYRVGMDKKYDVWVPPSDQTGDGRTSLNDKLGY